MCAVLSKLPMVTMKWKVKHASSVPGGLMCAGAGAGVRDREWTDVTASADDECIVQVELHRKCLSAKVSMIVCSRVTVQYHMNK